MVSLGFRELREHTRERRGREATAARGGRAHNHNRKGEHAREDHRDHREGELCARGVDALHHLVPQAGEGLGHHPLAVVEGHLRVHAGGDGFVCFACEAFPHPALWGRGNERRQRRERRLPLETATERPQQAHVALWALRALEVESFGAGFAADRRPLERVRSLVSVRNIGRELTMLASSSAARRSISASSTACASLQSERATMTRGRSLGLRRQNGFKPWTASARRCSACPSNRITRVRSFTLSVCGPRERSIADEKRDEPGTICCTSFEHLRVYLLLGLRIHGLQSRNDRAGKVSSSRCGVRKQTISFAQKVAHVTCLHIKYARFH